MLRLHRYFKDGAIIQCGKNITIKGYSTSDVMVEISLNDVKYIENARRLNGIFKASFKPINDTVNEYILKVTNQENESITINIRFGNVYLSIGQSNMSYTLASVENNEYWYDQLKKQRVAIIDLIEKPFNTLDEIKRMPTEQDDFIDDYEWKTGSNEDILNTSAISLETASLLEEKLNIPIGFVHTAMGGLTIESYVKRELIDKDPDFVKELKEYNRYTEKENWNNVGIENFRQTGSLYNEKIAPLKDFNFSGIVFYLGESACWHFDLAKCYKKSLGLLIDELRELFGDIPFIAINIAPLYYYYGDSYGYLYINEAIDDVAKEKENTFNIPIYDVEPRWMIPNGGEYFHPIHTVNKDLVSKRVAMALAKERIIYPYIKEIIESRNKLILKIGGVLTKLDEGYKNGFTIAGSDDKYYNAIAKVTGDDEITLWSKDVKKPKKCTYAFMQYQDFANVSTIDKAPLREFRMERIPIDERYFFTPSFTVKGAKEVYENNFGQNVGFTRKVNIWTSGKIYRAKAPKISLSKNGDIKITASPLLTDYKYFGISPEINLCGHKNHLDKFNYLAFSLKATGDVRFSGIVIKLVDGNIYRYNILTGDKKIDEVKLLDTKVDFVADLKNVKCGDYSEKELKTEDRQKISELEFYFRGESKVYVTLSNINLTDINSTKEVDFTIKKEKIRQDNQLPTN